MANRLGRRQFLKVAGAGAIAGAGMGAIGTPAVKADQAEYDGHTLSTARILSSCCAYTYRNEFVSKRMTMESFIENAVALRLDAVDMTVYFLRSTDSGYLESLRHLAYKNAVAFSGVACGVSMVQSDVTKRAESLTELKKWVDVTDRLGGSHLRVFAGKQPEGSSLSDCITWVGETMKAACDYSGKKGIALGLEDHAGVSQSADVCLEIMQRVNSDYARINIDISHFVPKPTQDSYAQIAACIPYASNTHVRTTFDDGSLIDLDRVWKMFADASFKGYMSFEGEELGTGVVQQQIAEFERLCKKYSSI
jgi:sugar phosphate isomerase/epimerase